jgi:MoxR-like ATPase
MGEETGEISEKYGDEPFSERPDQEEIFFELSSLGAQRRDLIRSTKKLEKELDSPDQEKTKPRPQIRRMRGGRRVRIASGAEGVAKQDFRRLALERSKQKLDEIRDQMQDIGKIPGIRDAYAKRLLKWSFLLKTNERVQEMKSDMVERQAEIDEIRQAALESPSGTVAGADRERLQMLEEANRRDAEIIESQNEYKEHAEVQRMQTLREYADEYNAGRMIEIPSVTKLVDDGLEHMRNHQPFLLAGHLGSGKTEMAKHMARLHMMENLDTIDGLDLSEDQLADPDKLYDALQPEIFSGGEEASVYDLVGKLKLAVSDKSDTEALRKAVEQAETGLRDIGVEGMSREEISKLILGKSDVTETVFNYGPLGRALKKGVPLIIDEINMIPPEVISRINDVLLRGVGDKVRLQENGEEEFDVKPGFAVLATCNLGAQYAGIQKVNAAFKSRWVSREVDYPSVEETYDLILAALVRKDRVRLPSDFPPEDFDKLTDLAIATREIQEIFSGQTEAQRFMAMSTAAVADRASLKESVVSTRDLMRKIIDPWKSGNFNKSMDEVIANEVLASEIFNIDDQKVMTEIFLRRGFFEGADEQWFKDHGIKTISQQEIDALQAAMLSDDYAEKDGKFGNLRSEAHDRAMEIKRSLMIGVGGAQAE